VANYSNQIAHGTNGSSLAEILERVLDKGIVIAGDISVSIADVELLSIKIRLVVASIDKAVEMGIDWWKTDPYLSTKAKKELDDNQAKRLEEENKALLDRLEKLEAKLPQ